MPSVRDPQRGASSREEIVSVESPALLELRRRLRMLTLIRISLATVLLGATALIEWQARIQSTASVATEVTIYRLVAIVCLLSLLYVVALKFVSGRKQLVSLAYVQLCGDCLLYTSDAADE